VLADSASGIFPFKFFRAVRKMSMVNVRLALSRASISFTHAETAMGP
jgi:hypothetical protein